MRSIKTRLRGLETLVADVIESCYEEVVTLVYEDGTQKTMGYDEAVMEVLGNCFCRTRIVDSDQPPGSFIWAMITPPEQNEEPAPDGEKNKK